MTPEASQHKKPLWRVRLFGGPVLEDAFGKETRHFRSQKVRALLAYLALHLGTSCPREVLYEALWPEEERQLVANRFRVALSSLRRHLEPDAAPFGSVLDVSEPGMVRLRPETTACDVFEFEALWRSGRRQEALRLAAQPLLPDTYEDWAVSARAHYDLLAQSADSSRKEECQPEDSEPSGRASVLPPPLSELPSATEAHSLPLFLTRFFGREREKGKLLDLIRGNRLVTITGNGGIGKTRLATETVRKIEWPCFFVALDPVSVGESLDQALLKPLGATRDTEIPFEEQVRRLLPHRGETLLILDSAEHVIDAAASTAVRLLEHIPTLHLLVTSRQILDIPGEAVLILLPLETPASSALPEGIMEYPAVALFMDRATYARPDFTLSARNVEAITEICRCLEGVPLALELAAARVTSQSPGQIAHALRQNLTGLKSRQRGLSERHRSLRTVIETSLNLLPDEVRSFFFSLALFQEDWTAEMARTLTGCARCEEFLELLAASSLIQCREDERLGMMRFSWPATIRQFALHADGAEEPASRWDSQDNLIVNGSFEADRPHAAWLNSDGGLFAYPFIVPSGWQGVGSVNVNVPNYAAFPNGVPDGSNTAVVGDQTRSGRLYQDIAAILMAETTYTLSAWVGNRANYAGSGRIRLETTGGNVLVDSGAVTPALGKFQQVTLTFTVRSDTRGLGEGLRVVLERADGLQANFDGVRLTAASTLPPDTADLLPLASASA